MVLRGGGTGCCSARKSVTGTTGRAAVAAVLDGYTLHTNDWGVLPPECNYAVSGPGQPYNVNVNVSPQNVPVCCAWMALEKPPSFTGPLPTLSAV
jgi:hypothetical protein